MGLSGESVPKTIKRKINLKYQSGTIEYNQVQSDTSGYHRVPGTSVVHRVYQVYQEDQDQISGATYISDVVFSEGVP